MSISTQQLVDATGCGTKNVDVLVDSLNAAMDRFGITTPLRMAHFLAQTAYESGLFVHVEENLNYTAQRLAAIFPTHFFLPPEDARGRVDASLCAGHPDLTANVAYENRLGNGARETGDGWKYRGRGFIQVTGRANYTALNGDLPQIPCVSMPDALTSLEYSSLSAAWFWNTHRCSTAADMNNCTVTSLRINGGKNGLPERMALTRRALAVFGIYASPQ